MSTKIYNGYALPKMTLEEIVVFNERFRGKVELKVRDQFAGFLGIQSANFFDDLILMDEKDFVKKYKKDESLETGEYTYESLGSVNALFHSYRGARTRYDEIQKSQMRDSEVDFDCNAVFIPSTDKTLVLFFAEKEEFTKIWEAEKEVYYYGYWNNVDPQEDISVADWEKRGNEWEKALGESGVPMNAGLIAEYSKGLPNLYNVSRDEIVRKIPSVKERATRLAKEKIQQERFSLTNSTDIHEKVEVFFKWLQSVEGQTAQIEQALNIEKSLFDKIDQSHLTATVTQLRDTILN